MAEFLLAEERLNFCNPSEDLPMNAPFRSQPASVALLFLLVSGEGGSAHAQSAALDSLVRNNLYTFEMSDGRLSGAGANWLHHAGHGAHFVALAENHNTRAIPEFAVGLFRLLHEAYGFNYLALEEGPALGHLLSKRVRGGRPDAAFRLGLEFPNAFHMYTEEELRMIDRIAAISRARTDPIWGLNQEFGLAHVLDRLVQIAPDARTRAVAAELLRRSGEYEGERFARNVFFISDVATDQDFQGLREAFRPRAGSEADRLISQATLSHRIYAPYRSQPRPHFTAFHESGRLREENMKRLFAERYREAQAPRNPFPKVLVKSGHTHLNRGLGRGNEVFTLGNFLSEVATFQGGESLHLYVLLNWNDLPESFFAPFVPHIRPETNTLFDLRPLQAWAAQNAFRDLHPDLRRVLVGYDALVILGDKTLGSVEALRTPNFRQYTGS